MEAPAEECSAASAAAARVEALFSSLPGGYDVDKEAATYDDNLTYGEMSTADLALLCQRVRGHWRSQRVQVQQTTHAPDADLPPGAAARRARLRGPRLGHRQEGYRSGRGVPLRRGLGDCARARRSRSSRARAAGRRRCGRLSAACAPPPPPGDCSRALGRQRRRTRASCAATSSRRRARCQALASCSRTTWSSHGRCSAPCSSRWTASSRPVRAQRRAGALSDKLTRVLRSRRRGCVRRPGAAVHEARRAPS